MNFAALFVVVLAFLSSVTCPNGKIRYANTMPQFGKATVRGFPPVTTVFSNVSQGSLTSYTSLQSNKFWVFAASFERNVTALSFPEQLDTNKYHSMFTYQKAQHLLWNKLVSDGQPNGNTTHAFLRTINLVQYNYPINAYNFSNNAELFVNISYGDASPYKPFPPGDYVTYWTSAFDNKRNVMTGGNVSGDPFLFVGRFYTFWALPGGSFIAEDGVDLKKRAEPIAADVAKLKMRRAVQKKKVVVVAKTQSISDVKAEDTPKEENEDVNEANDA